MFVLLSCFVVTSSFDLESDKKKKVKMHAKQYIDTVMSNIQKQIQDEQIFPTKFGNNNYNYVITLIFFSQYMCIIIMLIT